MIVTCHLCMPEGDAMRSRFGDLMEIFKKDNRAVIAAMRADGTDVPDTVGDLGLQYLPELHKADGYGPVMDIYGLRSMVDRGTFSCGDAAAFEAAILEEKYGVPTLCIAVSQGDDDLHAIFVTADSIVDPVANNQAGRRSKIPTPRRPLAGSECVIEDGRVVCVEEDACAVGEDGVWRCPALPGLTGRRASIGEIERSPNGQAWARTPHGAVVPVRRRGRP